MELIPAFLLGFLGSLHCIGMCGPIVLALPQHESNKVLVAMDGLLYNFGRILTYCMLGLLSGLIGSFFGLERYQGILEISIGAIILLYFIIPRKSRAGMADNKVFNFVSTKFRRLFNYFLNSHDKTSLAILGMLNGLLPCGLVYVALGGAIAEAELVTSISYMAAFGLGTFPVMFSIYFAKNFIPINWRRKLTKLIPYAIAALALLLIFRGAKFTFDERDAIKAHSSHTEKMKCCE
jgi:uncharacterized protein